MSFTVRGMVEKCGGAGSVVVEWNLDGRGEEGTGREKLSRWQCIAAAALVANAAVTVCHAGGNMVRRK